MDYVTSVREGFSKIREPSQGSVNIHAHAGIPIFATFGN